MYGADERTRTTDLRITSAPRRRLYGFLRFSFFKIEHFGLLRSRILFDESFSQRDPTKPLTPALRSLSLDILLPQEYYMQTLWEHDKILMVFNKKTNGSKKYVAKPPY
jgi:hypothetical protein